ncbi:MAG: hypothetical protein RBR41_09730 [Desulfovibrio sp.]|uniref:hypothetical protein n=1 Tax=Desulfovibrio sp. TaxID=885 RepID=UPI002A370A6D|nr:hypothetical protein [Desulfovibrio sp.]MDY0259929.1 hypothetical protein [Desulfovibrio sp.]
MRIAFFALCCFMTMALPGTLPSSAFSAESLPVIEADAASFKESFDQAVPVSGNIIAGLRFGDGAKKISANGTFLAPPQGRDVCVRVVTRDGRFSASNIYRLANDEQLSQANAAGRVHLSPITHSYAEKLVNYVVDDLAVSAFMASEGGCAAGKTPYVPQIVSQGTEKVFTVLVNSGGRSCRLTLQPNRKSVQCARFSNGARIAYDQECVMDVSHLTPGINNFVLVLDDGFNEERSSFQVIVPSNLP